MNIQTLLQYFNCFTDNIAPLGNMSLDSRSIQPGDVFVALAGIQTHGKIFIEDALSKGASAILCDTTQPALSVEWIDQCIPVIYIPDLKTILPSLAQFFYQTHAAHLNVVGVTGTNGKTSCTHFIARMFEILHMRCGIIGTLGYGFRTHLQHTQHTTPDVLTLHRMLAQLNSEQAQWIAMEVSSHALDQQRVEGIPFSVGILTNLTQDHLDYHSDMEHYAAAKKKLFLWPTLKCAIVNLDDAFGHNLWSYCRSKDYRTIGFSLSKPSETHIAETVYTSLIETLPTGIRATLHTPIGEGILHIALLGHFNLSNVLAAMSVFIFLGYPLEKILAAATQLISVPGRMQTLEKHSDQPLVVIDYAHTPDALFQVLHTLRAHCSGKLWCVFGCGGNRDTTKRAKMGRIAEQCADRVVITDDNPRHESPQHIVEHILSGFLEPHTAMLEHDRALAIQKTISTAHADDVILIAGKGHETEQIIGDIRRPFSDVLVARQALLNKGSSL